MKIIKGKEGPEKMIFFECDHEQWNELDNPQYCINGNELDGVFCHVCKKEFVHKDSNDPKKKKGSMETWFW